MPEFNIHWIDSGHGPQCVPNPAYPKGMDMDVAGKAIHSCHTALPYPAKRCGHYVISCKACGVIVTCSTAGRTDDPRSIRVACNRIDKKRLN